MPIGIVQTRSAANFERIKALAHDRGGLSFGILVSRRDQRIHQARAQVRQPDVAGTLVAATPREQLLEPGERPRLVAYDKRKPK